MIMSSPIKKHHTQTTEGDIAERHASVLLAQNPKELEEAYDKWAVKYDEDLTEISGLPTFGLTAVKVMQKLSYGPSEYPKLLDFGCGTGAAGPLLRELGWNNVIGGEEGAGKETVLHCCDLSQGMLDVASSRNCYDKVIKSIYGNSGAQHGYYDIVHASGVFAPAQAPPETFDEFINLLRKGGTAIFTVRTGYYDGPEGSDHKKRLEELCQQKKWEIVSQTEEEYLPKEGLVCYVFCMKKL